VQPAHGRTSLECRWSYVGGVRLWLVFGLNTGRGGVGVAVPDGRGNTRCAMKTCGEEENCRMGRIGKVVDVLVLQKTHELHAHEIDVRGQHG
jgi:hypothetical protein